MSKQQWRDQAHHFLGDTDQKSILGDLQAGNQEQGYPAASVSRSTLAGAVGCEQVLTKENGNVSELEMETPPRCCVEAGIP